MVPPDDLQTPKLQQRAKEILARSQAATKQSGLTPPPLYVEFAGSPKSGKSTCIDIVSHFLSRVGFKVHAPTEGASKRTPYFLKNDWVAFNAWCASYALSHILEGVHGSDRYDIAILDRGLFDSLAWFNLLSKQGKISKKDYRHIANFILLDHWRRYISEVFLFRADPQTSLKREGEYKLIAEFGQAMNPTTLAELNRAYRRIMKDYKDLFPKFTVIDTSEKQQTTARSTAFEVTNHLLDLLDGRLAK